MTAVPSDVTSYRTKHQVQYTAVMYTKTQLVCTHIHMIPQHAHTQVIDCSNFYLFNRTIIPNASGTFKYCTHALFRLSAHTEHNTHTHVCAHTHSTGLASPTVSDERLLSRLGERSSSNVAGQSIKALAAGMSCNGQ